MPRRGTSRHDARVCVLGRQPELRPRRVALTAGSDRDGADRRCAGHGCGHHPRQLATDRRLHRSVVAELLSVAARACVEGYIGYLLAPDISSAVVEPRYIASYVTISEVDGQPLVSRKKTVAVHLTSVSPSLEAIYDW